MRENLDLVSSLKQQEYPNVEESVWPSYLSLVTVGAVIHRALFSSIRMRG
jgi:hypothetical protein